MDFQNQSNLSIAPEDSSFQKYRLQPLLMERCTQKLSSVRHLKTTSYVGKGWTKFKPYIFQEERFVLLASDLCWSAE